MSTRQPATHAPHDVIDRGGMRLRLRPIVEVATHDVTGAGALARWQRPGAGPLADVAENTGESAELGAWLTGQACRTAAGLARLGGGRLTVSIDLSARQLGAGSPDMLRTALRDSGCEPWRVIVDVSGTAFVEDTAALIETLSAIRRLGVGVGLADFGTGGSSLLYLKDLPLDRITIDPSFVRGLGIDPRVTAIVASTIALAHALGVGVLADGVGSVDQLTLLRGMGCDLARGDLVSPPLTLGELQRWLREHRPASRRRAPSPPPATAPEAGHILRLHGEGASLLTIAGALNADGQRTALGVRWSPRSVARVVTGVQLTRAGAAR